MGIPTTNTSKLSPTDSPVTMTTNWRQRAGSRPRQSRCRQRACAEALRVGLWRGGQPGGGDQAVYTRHNSRVRTHPARHLFRVGLGLTAHPAPVLRRQRNRTSNRAPVARLCADSVRDARTNPRDRRPSPNAGQRRVRTRHPVVRPAYVTSNTRGRSASLMPTPVSSTRPHAPFSSDPSASETFPSSACARSDWQRGWTAPARVRGRCRPPAPAFPATRLSTPRPRARPRFARPAHRRRLVERHLVECRLDRARIDFPDLEKIVDHWRVESILLNGFRVHADFGFGNHAVGDRLRHRPDPGQRRARSWLTNAISLRRDCSADRSSHGSPAPTRPRAW